ncbi:hypothetical protein D1007_19183 [Hordeum vulgare]|nr:hypothetical protein D1007_19183 [Hordeum vulgare]
MNANTGWSMEEIAIGAQARMHKLACSLEQLQSAGLEKVKALWPNAVEPASMSRLSRWLEASSSRLDAWRVSATRAGAYMALHLAKSWYQNLDLGKLAAQSACSEEELVAL